MKVTIEPKAISAIVWKEGKWYVAKGLEVEIASQGKTKKEAIKNLKEALELYFEDTPEEVLNDILPLEDVSVEHLPLTNA